MDYFLKRFESMYESFLFSQRIYRSDPGRCEENYAQCLKAYDNICHQHDYGDDFSRRLRLLAGDFKHKVTWAYNRFKEQSYG